LSGRRNYQRTHNINTSIVHCDVKKVCIFFHDLTAPIGPGSLLCQGFTITLRHTTLGRTPLDEWSARLRSLWQHTVLTRGNYPCCGWDSNPQSQQASHSGRTP